MFYADNGSAAVEVALKMAFHWFRNRGEPERHKFIALHNGYHGETLGALAVGDIPLYRRIYAPLLAEAIFAPARCLRRTSPPGARSNAHWKRPMCSPACSTSTDRKSAH